MDSKQLTDKIVEILNSRKGKEIDVIKVEKVTILTDYLVICSGTSNTHIKALANEVDYELKKEGIVCNRAEGFDTAQWILMDYGNVIVNIFDEEQRKYYSLEKMWADGVITRQSADLPGGQ